MHSYHFGNKKVDMHSQSEDVVNAAYDVACCTK